MVAESRLAAIQPVVTQRVLSHSSFLPWYWLNTEKYAFLDKIKAIKSIPYIEQEAQNSRAGSTIQKLPKSPQGREHISGDNVCKLGKFPSHNKQLALLWWGFYKKKNKKKKTNKKNHLIGKSKPNQVETGDFLGCGPVRPLSQSTR